MLDWARVMMTSLRLSQCFAIGAIVIASALICISVVFANPTDILPGIMLTFALSWAAFVDMDRQILPDALTLGLLVSGFVFRLIDGGDELLSAAIGAFAGFASIHLLGWIYLNFRGVAGIGGGDAKLVAATGAWIGWELLPVFLLVASASALVVIGIRSSLGMGYSNTQRIAFGPYLAVGFWICWHARESLRSMLFA